MKMVFYESGEGLPHIPLSLIGREGGKSQRPSSFRQGAQHFLRQLRHHIQQEAYQSFVRLSDQAIGGNG